MNNIYDCPPGESSGGLRHRLVVGHSYIVYGPLFNGNTTVLYEGQAGRRARRRLLARDLQHKVRALHRADGVRASSATTRTAST
jgi:propionyl-CoA synthetase